MPDTPGGDFQRGKAAGRAEIDLEARLAAIEQHSRDVNGSIERGARATAELTAEVRRNHQEAVEAMRELAVAIAADKTTADTLLATTATDLAIGVEQRATDLEAERSGRAAGLDAAMKARVSEAATDVETARSELETERVGRATDLAAGVETARTDVVAATAAARSALEADVEKARSDLEAERTNRLFRTRHRAVAFAAGYTLLGATTLAIFQQLFHP